MSLDNSLEPFFDLAVDDLNRTPSFTPEIAIGEWPPDKRHTPILRANTPWGPGDKVWIEVPEYVYAQVQGEPFNPVPFYFGRSLNNLKVFGGGAVRYPSLEEPEWTPSKGGGQQLNNPLDGGYVQRFKVIPHDRMLEIRVGITNNTEKALTNIRTQLCMMPHAANGFTERYPTASKMFSNGEVISWDSAGQSLDWLEAYRNKETGRFSQSCFFNAPVKGHEPRGGGKDRDDLMWLKRIVDIPAVAHQSVEKKDRYLIVYSPFGRTAFYNCLVPCLHADPEMNGVGPGETRWTVSYYFYFEGDLADFFGQLKALHDKLAREEGFADPPCAPES